MSIPFLNSVINIIYHMENQEFSRYVGDYDEFMKVREVKRAQLKAAYDKQQKEIAGLKDFVARNKARSLREIWPCPVRKNWIKWISSS